ncbi:MAG: MarR family winged helix-turn-helix transcriptional regulator [Solirubrobacteraceae bacterium]
MSIPVIGERYRGIDGQSGYLLRQAWQSFHNAIDNTLRNHGINGAQYAVLSVLARDPGVSGADLARACNTTPQAMNGVLATLEREALIERHPHPTHGRILQVELTDEGRRRLETATPEVGTLEQSIDADFTADEITIVKRWLVKSALLTERPDTTKHA